MTKPKKLKPPNYQVKALRLGIFQPKQVPGKKGKGSYKRNSLSVTDAIQLIP